ncbi:MAG: amidohydrolase family protein [Bryobacterales bacterium]
MKRISICVALVVSCTVATAPLGAQNHQPIIDMHMHTHHPADVPAGAPAICRPEPCEGKGAALASSQETMQATVEQMRRHNIVKGVLSGPNPSEVQQWAEAAPKRFIPSVFIFQPGQPTAAALASEYDAGRLLAMGEIATQLNGIAPNDPRLAPYFALAAKRDLPVLIHVEGIGPYLPNFRSAAGNPVLLEDVLVRYPDLRIYVENAGFPYLGEMISMMYQYPQLHADLSTISWVIPRSAFYNYLQELIDAGLGKRLMFGSDQMRWPEAIGWAVEAIDEAPFLTDEQRRDIFYGNAARFLRLEDRAN